MHGWMDGGRKAGVSRENPRKRRTQVLLTVRHHCTTGMFGYTSLTHNFQFIVWFGCKVISLKTFLCWVSDCLPTHNAAQPRPHTLNLRHPSLVISELGLGTDDDNTQNQITDRNVLPGASARQPGKNAMRRTAVFPQITVGTGPEVTECRMSI